MEVDRFVENLVLQLLSDVQLRCLTMGLVQMISFFLDWMPYRIGAAEAGQFAGRQVNRRN